MQNCDKPSKTHRRSTDIRTYTTPNTHLNQPVTHILLQLLLLLIDPQSTLTFSSLPPDNTSSLRALSTTSSSPIPTIRGNTLHATAAAPNTTSSVTPVGSTEAGRMPSTSGSRS